MLECISRASLHHQHHNHFYTHSPIVTSNLDCRGPVKGLPSARHTGCHHSAPAAPAGRLGRWCRILVNCRLSSLAACCSEGELPSYATNDLGHHYRLIANERTHLAPMRFSMRDVQGAPFVQGLDSLVGLVVLRQKGATRASNCAEQQTWCIDRMLMHHMG